jgi:hypothetical protein
LYSLTNSTKGLLATKSFEIFFGAAFFAAVGVGVVVIGLWDSVGVWLRHQPPPPQTRKGGGIAPRQAQAAPTLQRKDIHRGMHR